jgi:hypothetical protein
MIDEESESESLESETEDEELLHMYGAQEYVTSTVNNISVRFRIDTGAKTRRF